MNPLIDAARVREIALSSFYNEKDRTPDGREINEGNIPSDSVVANGIMLGARFHPQRLEKNREEVTAMVKNLPSEFQPESQGGGGGWSFLNMANDKNDVQWTGFHRIMDTLLALGIGLGVMEINVPRELWAAFPAACRMSVLLKRRIQTRQ